MLKSSRSDERISLANILDEAIQDCGSTRKEVASKMGLSLGQLVRLEKGTRRFHKSKLSDMISILPTLEEKLHQTNLLTTMSVEEMLVFLKELESYGLRREHFDSLKHDEGGRRIIVDLIRRFTDMEPPPS